MIVIAPRGIHMIVITDFQQGTDAWVKAKLGKPSASNASKLLTNEGKQSKQRISYLHELAAERITGKVVEGYQNKNMADGQDRENESRAFYELLYGVDVVEVGVVYKDKKKAFLCSPDGIVGNYGLEMKNPLPKTQVKYLLEGKLPPEYFSQIQFSLYVAEFKFWDFLSYVPNMPHLVIRVKRDKDFISKLAQELESFCKELEIITAKIRG